MFSWGQGSCPALMLIYHKIDYMSRASAGAFIGNDAWQVVFDTHHSGILLSYMIDNSPQTLPQFLSGIVHFFIASHVARYRAFCKEATVGNMLRWLFRCLYALLILSIVFVVYITFRTSAENLNIGIRESQKSSHRFIAFGCLFAHFSATRFNVFRTWCTIQLWYSISRNAVAIDSFIPVSPLAHSTKISCTPRFFRLLSTLSQYLALSFSPTVMLNTPLYPFAFTPRIMYAASFLIMCSSALEQL